AGHAQAGAEHDRHRQAPGELAAARGPRRRAGKAAAHRPARARGRRAIAQCVVDQAHITRTLRMLTSSRLLWLSLRLSNSTPAPGMSDSPGSPLLALVNCWSISPPSTTVSPLFRLSVVVMLLVLMMGSVTLLPLPTSTSARLCG